MKRVAPQVIQEANVYINGKGYLGVSKNVKIPTIEWEMIENKGALSANYSAGVLKDTQMSFKLNVLDLNTFLSFGLNSFSNRVPFLFKASIHQSGKFEDVPLSLAVTGDIVSLETTELESGKEMEVDITMSAHFMSLIIDGKPLILKDTENMICIIGGVDYMAKVRSNLGE
ncbi:MAG: phage major tail tube protein [Campylobacter sp.]|nr:phage major tail tube protein [Campylobacter sp.]